MVANAQNGLSLMHHWDSQFHDFNKISDIRTVFWVVSQNTLLLRTIILTLCCWLRWGQPGAIYFHKSIIMVSFGVQVIQIFEMVIQDEWRRIGR